MTRISQLEWVVEGYAPFEKHHVTVDVAVKGKDKKDTLYKNVKL
jgi:hypothetical protein